MTPRVVLKPEESHLEVNFLQVIIQQQCYYFWNGCLTCIHLVIPAIIGFPLLLSLHGPLSEHTVCMQF